MHSIQNLAFSAIVYRHLQMALINSTYKQCQLNCLTSQFVRIGLFFFIAVRVEIVQWKPTPCFSTCHSAADAGAILISAGPRIFVLLDSPRFADSSDILAR